MTHLETFWRDQFTPPDQREIWEWIEQEGELPACYAVSGKFDIRTAPMVKGPLRALKNPVVREVVSMAAVQCLKTLIGEMWLVWSIAENPGPTQWLHGTDQEAKEHSKERFTRLLDAFPAIRRYYTTDRHDKTTAAIHFQHMTLRMEGAETRSNLQRKSVKNQMRSEVWQTKHWPKGTLKEADSRMTQFVHNSKAYTESQPGTVAELDVDDVHSSFLRGSQQTWHFKCLSCGKAQPFYWNYTRPDGSRAAMRWETSDRTRRENGEWRWSELEKTVRYECVFCGHAHSDDPLTRRRLTDSGHFVALNADAPPAVESFTWNQLAMPNLSWWETKIGGVRNFLIALEQAKRGYNKPLIEFYQKVVAEPYNPMSHEYQEKLATVTIEDGAVTGGTIVHDKTEFNLRLAAFDVQADHLWGLAEAWNAAGDSLTLEAAKLFSWDEARAFQEKWNVPDQNVLVDQSHRGFEVVQACCRFGHTERISGRDAWVCWKAMRGSDQDHFQYRPSGRSKRAQAINLPYAWPPAIGDPCSGLRTNDPRRAEFQGKVCQIITWSNPTIKDVVIARRDGRARGIKNLVRQGDWNEEFNRQMHSQKKVPVTAKYGGSKWRWEKFRDDHLLDCKCMIVARAFMLHILGGGKVAD